jgi:hypothetical protein
MEDNFDALKGSTGRDDQLALSGVTTDQDVRLVQPGAAGRTPTSEHQNIETADALARLLAGYGEALDSIELKPPIVFLSRSTIPRNWPGQFFSLPYANFITSILALRHVASRVDILLRRGQRFRALRPHEPNPIDIDRLKDFRDSLLPVKTRTLVLWVIALGLAIAFPVAWITDGIRDLAPEVIVCSSRFSIKAAISRFVGTPFSPVTTDCRPRSRYSLVYTLDRIAHLSLSPGGVIDAFSSARAGGGVTLLLLTVVLTLSLCVVLLAFMSGFRLKRLAFSPEEHRSPLNWPPSWSEIRSDGLYRLEKDAFESVGLRCPREFPLDLAARAGMLVLPLTISMDLLYTAWLPKLDIVTRVMLEIGAAAFIAFAVLLLSRLIKIWRSRCGTKLMHPRQYWLPDGSVLRATNCTYITLLMITGLIAIEFTAIEDPGISRSLRIISILFLGPVLVWSLSPVSWYRLHRELASYGGYLQLRLIRRPVLTIIAPLSLAAASLMFYIWIVNAPAAVNFIASILVFVGFIGMPVSIYRMARNLHRLRRHATHRRHEKWKARIVGMCAVPLILLPFAAVLYFQRSLDKVALQITKPHP